jgi:hypothetical protein
MKEFLSFKNCTDGINCIPFRPEQTYLPYRYSLSIGAVEGVHSPSVPPPTEHCRLETYAVETRFRSTMAATPY